MGSTTIAATSSRVDNLLEKLALDELSAIRAAVFRRMPVGAAIGIGVRSVENTGKQRSEPLALPALEAVSESDPMVRP